MIEVDTNSIKLINNESEKEYESINNLSLGYSALKENKRFNYIKNVIVEEAYSK